MRAVLAFLLLVLLPGAAWGQGAGTYVLVEGRSAVTLEVASPFGPALLSLPVEGEMSLGAGGRVTGGIFVLDPGAMRADALVAQQMRGPEGFDVARFPEATFEAERGRVTDERMTLEGSLTVRGVTRPIRVAGSVVRARGRRFTAELAGTLDRTEFGIVAGRPIYSRQATVRVRLVAARPR